VSASHTRPLKVGLELPVAEGRGWDGVPRWADILAIARRAEQVGFDSLWVEDHLLVRGDDGTHGLWECWSLLAALAAVTERVTLAPFVACAGFRNPALLAKMTDTLDEISGGRVILGLGAGWNETDFSAFGFPFEQRVSRFEEAIQIIHGLLRHGALDFDGRFYQARDCELRPRGPRPNGPPLLVGSTGKRMLRIAARYADAINGPANTLERLAVLKQQAGEACAAVARDPATLAVTVAVLVDFTNGQGVPSSLNPARKPPLSGSAAEMADLLRAYAANGVSHVQLTPLPLTLASVEKLAPVLELLDQA
jgi:probable F420-dependent oxidoreductase